jgi:hypothetical protein
MIPKQAIKAETGGNTTLRANGTECRAKALPKMLTPFEGAHLFREVSILENSDDSFEDAHPFPRCSPEHAKTVIQCGFEVSRSGVALNRFRYNCRQSFAIRADLSHF